MSIQFNTYIGVEVSPDRTYPFTYAAIDEELVIRALGHGKIKDAYFFSGRPIQRTGSHKFSHDHQ